MEYSDFIPKFGLENLGLTQLSRVNWNLTTPQLYEQAIRRFEGTMAHLGPLVVRMGQHTGRAAKDKYVVDEPATSPDIWWGKVNVKYPEEKFDRILARMQAYLRNKTVFVQDLYAGADPDYRQSVRVVSEYAWSALFSRNMFIQQKGGAEEAQNFVPDFTVLHCPMFNADPEIDGTRSGTFVMLHLSRKLILIGGSAYGGEIKKSIFTAMNFLLPGKKVLSMHCSANHAPKDQNDVAIFFGLSGTGKTTLSADPSRTLIGDDEHGWGDKGIFNFEGGCYAKVIRLSAESEPDIYETTRRFGTILENVAMDPFTRRLDLDDASLTENTRASYPLTHIPNASRDGMAGHAKNVIMLTCDAFGVLPPIAKLTPEQAMYHFISGYTAKVAGTELGVTEPSATFSTCFGAPFMVRVPAVYAQLLADRLEKHKADCWLVNTGWSGGAYGVGKRMSIKVTRALIDAVLDGSLAKVKMRKDERFGFEVPQEVPGVPADVLNPRETWPDKEAYDAQANKLAELFIKNMEQFKETPAKVLEAGPKKI